MSCTTTVAVPRSPYIPKRVRRSSNFRQDIPQTAPVPLRPPRLLPLLRRVTHPVKSIEEGIPKQHLGKEPEGGVLHDEWMVICSHLLESFKFYFSINPLWFSWCRLSYTHHIADILYFSQSVYIWDPGSFCLRLLLWIFLPWGGVPSHSTTFFFFFSEICCVPNRLVQVQ